MKTSQIVARPAPVKDRRRLLFACATAVFAAGVVEAVSAIGLYCSLETGLTFEGLEARQEMLALASRSRDDSTIVVHPFTGWCLNPQVSEGQAAFGRQIPVNQLGFVDDQESLQKRGPDRLLIGVTGGSVAWQMTVGAEELICETLRQSPQLRNLDIRILRICQSGYKQPQQLMTVNWLMALGGEFDAVVNLDGYNELALTMSENFDRQIHSGYPRAWNARMLEMIDPRDSMDRMRLLEIDAFRQRIARQVTRVPWRWSFTASVLWSVRDRFALNEKLQLTTRLMEKRSTGEGLGFAESGPVQSITDRQEMLELAAGMWRRGSLQMHRLLESSGTVYLHVLQPNQHHDGSKPLSPDEIKMSRNASPDEAGAIRDGYPLLLAGQHSLQAAGVEFLNLSALYADEPEAMYVDGCCHLNAEGNRRLARSVALTLRPLLEQSHAD